ncbi:MULTISPECIES: hypothetical protein [unclassified Streptomyces]|nr:MULTISPECIES: hypothetical protein [unclassified Streptomyces]
MPEKGRLRDAATGAAPVAIDTSSLGLASDLLRAALWSDAQLY